MSHYESTIEIDRPVREVYNAWTQFEDFPQFMSHVDQVSQIDDTHLHWQASIAGREHEWDAVITQQRPDEIIAWQATDGAENRGEVTFEPVDESCTRIKLHMHYDPESMIEKAAVAAGGLHLSVDRDLASFKELVESGEDSGQGWRGEVVDGERTDESSSSIGISDADAFTSSGEGVAQSGYTPTGFDSDTQGQGYTATDVDESTSGSGSIY